MVQIDDSGSGSLIGGTCIGVYDTNTGSYYFDVIPLYLYDESNFKSKKYLDYTILIIKNAFKFLNISNDCKIQVCQGYMFDNLRKWFDINGYSYENVEITGKLQELVEKSFETYAMSLGFPSQYINYTRYPFHFHRILRWVYADYENRFKLCKTGWKSWQKYSNLSVDIVYEIYNSQKKYLCLKCGKAILKDSNVKVLRYISNAPNTIFLHRDC